MSGAGFLDTDPLFASDYAAVVQVQDSRKETCVRHVFQYFQTLPTFTQVVPASACTGAHAMYERVPERYTSSSVTPLVYTNRLCRFPLCNCFTLPFYGSTAVCLLCTARLTHGHGSL